MWNVVWNGDVGIWWGTVMWNVPENGDVKYGGDRWCEIWWITLVWNMVDNVDVGMWLGTVV